MANGELVFPALVVEPAAPPAPPVREARFGAVAADAAAPCVICSGIAVEPVAVLIPTSTSELPVAADVSPKDTAVLEFVVVAALKANWKFPSAKVWDAASFPTWSRVGTPPATKEHVEILAAGGGAL